MWTDAKAEGLYLLVDSAYRSYDKQQQVYKQYENQKGTKYADSIAARPGFSEHQTGLVLDIYSKECYDQAKFKDSKTYAWLIANSYKYGFILRYPEGKDNLTGYKYESWHYRYLGKELARKVFDSGLTYDEYYAYYIEGDK
jgi:D-alanyl-D-alanine carboxypeptidase